MRRSFFVTAYFLLVATNACAGNGDLTVSGTVYGANGSNVKVASGITFPDGTSQTTASKGYQIVTQSKYMAAYVHSSVSVTCPPGKVVTGGGCTMNTGSAGTRFMKENGPVGSNSWVCSSGDVSNPYAATVTVSAICISP